MKSGNLFWGIVLVTIGTLFILKNMGLLFFNWFALAQLWPVLLIVLGISLLPIKTAVRVFLSFLIVIGSIVFVSNSAFHSNHHSTPFWFWEGENFRFNWKDNEKAADETDQGKWDDQLLYENYNEEIEFAVLDMDAIAGTFSLKSSEDHLFRFDRTGDIGRYYLRSDNAGSAVVLKLRLDNEINAGPNMRNEAEISLHPEPLWDFKIDAGASKIDFDLEPFKVNRININGGATAIDMKLGDKFDKTDLSIDSGASSVTIKIPENSGCQVRTNTILTGRSMDSFSKIDDNIFQTPDFDAAANKIFISIDAAVSNLRIERY
jgi:energy-coupling factor transporter transmembrane protein EcfT